MKKAEAYWPLILLMALIKFVLPIFLQSPVYELQRDEFLYYQQGLHPALGYLENPPLISWMAMISSWFGGSEAWIKFWPCLLGAGTVILTCLITAELGGNRFAQFLASLGIITGAYLRIHFLFQPNILDIFFWTLVVYFLVCYINNPSRSNIYGIFISLALGWWGKYSIVFIGAALVLGLLLTPHRKIFRKKETWIAILFACIIIAPNIAWQFTHNWPVIHHMRELRETQLQFVDPMNFLKDQVLMLLPVAIVWITGFVWLLKRPAYRIVCIIYILVIVLLIVGNGKNYYALGIYQPLLAAGAVSIENWSSRFLWVRAAMVALIFLLTLPFIPLLLPTKPPEELAQFYKKFGIEKTGLLEWEDQQNHPLPQDFADMTGWKELSEKAERFYNVLPDTTKKQTIIFGRHYGHAGALSYYAGSKDFRKKIITDNGSFLLWIPADIQFRHLLFIGRRMPEADDEVFQHFRNYILVDSVTNPWSRQHGDKIIFFRDIDEEGLRLAKEELEEEKNRFRR
jgi:hypothetical protein